MEDPDRPGDHACPHTLVTSIPDGIHKHKHTHNVNRWIEAKVLSSSGGCAPTLPASDPTWTDPGRGWSQSGPSPAVVLAVVLKGGAESSHRAGTLSL